MKVLHVITGLNNGGAEAALYRLTTGDNQNTHEVVALMDGGVYGERLTKAGIRVHTLNMPRGRVMVRSIIRLYRLMRSTRPDVVQTWMYHADLIGGTIARLAGMKFVVWGIRGPFDRQRTGLWTEVTIRLSARFSKWVPKAIVVSSAHAARTHERVGYSRDKFVNIPNGYPLSRFRPDETARAEVLREFHMGANIALIGMVARFDPYKDHETLLGALAIVAKTGRQFACLLVGPGMDSANHPLLELVRRYGVQEMVRLTGPRDDVPRIMAALDLHVLSSAAESFPNVLAEAMACGTPCVTTDVGDAAIIVDNTGWVVPHSNRAALADAILSALVEMQDSAGWSTRKEACRKRVIDNYSLERMVASYTQVWGRCRQ